MQKTIIFLGAILLACSVQAQTMDAGSTQAADSTNHYHMDRNFRSFAHNRHLIHYSPEQRKQILDINMDYRRKAADLFKNDNLTLGQYKAGLIALHKARKSKILALLTQQQKDQIAKRKQRASEDRQVMAAARMERLKLRLNLTDQQVAILRKKEEDLHTQRQAIHDNDNLLPTQKMEQSKDLMAKRKDVIRSVLTPDQLATFNSMESAREDHQAHEDRPMRRRFTRPDGSRTNIF